MSDLTPQENARYIAGCAWGLPHSDMVMAVINADEKRLVSLETYHLSNWAEQANKFYEVCEKWKVLSCWGEVGTINNMATRYLGLPFRAFNMTQRSKTALIHHLGMAIDYGELKLLSETHGLMVDIGGDRKATPSAIGPDSRVPDTKANDVVIAIALAWHGVEQLSYSGIRW